MFLLMWDTLFYYFMLHLAESIGVGKVLVQIGHLCVCVLSAFQFLFCVSNRML